MRRKNSANFPPPQNFPKIDWFSVIYSQVSLRQKKGEARVISDAFPLPYNRFGRYACCERGLVLVTGEKDRIENTASGSLVKIAATGQYDEKSGAMISAL